VNRDPRRAAFSDHLRVLVNVFDAFPAETKLRGDGNFWWYGIAYRAHDFPDPVGMPEEGSATVVSVNGWGGAAEVDIDAVRASAASGHRADRHPLGITAENLDLDGQAGRRSAGVLQFGHIPQEDLLR